MSHTTSAIDYYCGKRAVLHTSWTDDNPGRRFHSCLKWKRGGCKFFDWEDPPMCRRAMAIIPGLLRKVNAMEAENEKLKKSLEMMKRTCICLVVAFVLFQLLSCLMK
ncbi:DNA topoisomerase 3-alpha [Striga hermonthica]|uniref:DNA topoisomerase 3-alpha n=1 Tax=Striga hermonthica TaxID=68872 RepID=A0A9N7P1I9_STRHE|nr:DNA topoisomerase 3-alpha [Striga hermonthica]